MFTCLSECSSEIGADYVLPRTIGDESLGLRVECAWFVGVNGALNYLAVKNLVLFELIAPRLRGESTL